MKRRQLLTVDQAVPAKGQHKKPCSDCPWARTALRGWLGSWTPEQWLAAAHGEEKIDCHTMTGAQCAGAAIYRSNVCKDPRDRTLLILPVDRERVFANPREFLEHHEAREKQKETMAITKQKKEEDRKAKPVGLALMNVIATLDQVSHPDKLTKKQYKELLEELDVDISGRLEAVTEELKAEGDDSE